MLNRSRYTANVRQRSHAAWHGGCWIQAYPTRSTRNDPVTIAQLPNNQRVTDRTGTVSGGRQGTGTYSTASSRSGDTTTKDVTKTFASGRTVNDIIDITHNPDGSITRSATDTLGNGKTTQRDTTLLASQDGTRAIIGTSTNAAGETDQIRGTRVTSAGGIDTSLTFTNAAGQTATSNVASSTTGSVTTSDITGTSFSGQQLAETITKTQIT
jgi:hypothetical protein